MSDPGNLFSYALVILLVVAVWFTFLKAGRPGWAAIIPFYNLYTLCKVAGRPGWWLVLLLIPLVNIVFGIIVALDIARLFGKGGAFGFFLLWLLPFIGYPIIAWGDAYYRGPKPGEPAGPGTVVI
ncbi:DUF5684 domain-containing protein [Herbiconiux daphne]|uniref:DUF5684 domain-containing protein n=1 Tax=Herbiconiux daphne TaxID=2970914 RepID=A0ABT2GWM1_9MICO|nr:DUF5684 domain-containing protein [Herbiconiux daphne]MCS5732360.1 DUF5684 domain-containing protein [Herbiconiux daphne]